MSIGHYLEHNGLWQLTRARTRGFLREPEAIFWVFVFPILLALALGIAFRVQKPQPLPVGIAPGAHGDAIARTLSAAPDLRVVSLPSAAEAEMALRTGKIVALIDSEDGETTASRAARTVSDGDAVPSLRVVYDPTRQENRLAQALVVDALQRGAGRVDPVHIEAVTRTQRGARYIDFLLPGIIGMNLLGTGMWGIGFPIATARQQKLLKRYMATPMRRSDYLLSFLFARIVWLLLEVAALYVFGWLVFGIKLTGSWAAYVVVVLLGALSFSSLGLLVVSRARTIEAVSGLMNVVMLPMWLLSGTFFSSARFPQVVQPLVQALPLTAVNSSLRALTNEAAGFSAVSPSLLLLAGWGLVSFVVALRIFRWE
ncbi:MAG TPA: ABC transporter permease [Candidatus Krumholzibacteria bacterium]|nr:ABC transporter permease [Candidatus Krumholzibacteria bacterium]